MSDTESPSSKGNKKQSDGRRAALRKIAEDTLTAIDNGFTLNGKRIDLEAKVEDSKRRTAYYAPDSLLSTWSGNTSAITPRAVPTDIAILEISTLEAARLLAMTATDNDRISILNFASAKKPGGGFLTGAQAQEESIARSSTLYPTLLTSTAQEFYTLHTKDAKSGYYSHAMIYSPGVIVFRSNDGGWEEPIEVDVVTSPAVNVGVVQKSLMGQLSVQGTQDKIERVMKERMGRILFLMEKQGAKHIVLGSFGTGVFQNKVEVIARVWSQLLTAQGARFKNSFSRVVFGILGKETFHTFKTNFTY